MCYEKLVQGPPIKLLDVVAVLEDKPDKGLLSGQVGTVVEELGAGVFEVEFLDSSGRTIGLAEFTRDELLLLRHDTANAA